MQIIKDRALLLRLHNPSLVTNTIPKSAVLKHANGQPAEVLVDWSLDAATVLKNIGIKDVPSPIIRQYAWPGIFRPMGHQVITASFLTLNRRAYCFSEQGCVDSETEYLSPTGWKKISDYESGKVAQYHPETGVAEFVDPTEYVKLPCPEMIKLKTKYGLDQMLSPEHRVLLVDGKKEAPKREVVLAKALLERHDAYHAGERKYGGGYKAGTDTVAFSGAAIPVAFHITGTPGIDLTDAQIRLQVAVMADGYFPKRSKSTVCVVRIKRVRKIDRLRRLLSEAGVEYSERPAVDGFRIFRFRAPRREKVYSEWWWSASPEQLRVITREVLHWDGSLTSGKRRFSSYVEQTSNFVQYAFVATGEAARLRPHTHTERENGGTDYCVYVRDTTRLFLRGSAPTMERVPSTDGFKYCFMVPSTFLVFRRNGCVFLSGNTSKTACTIWAADYLMNIGKVKRVLVICPLSTMHTAWESDLFNTVMHRRVGVAYGDAERRRKVIHSNAEFVIINTDGVKTCLKDLQAGGFDLVIIDEATSVKTPSTDRWKLTNTLVTPAHVWLWMLTGTPVSQNPMDAYGLAKMMNPSTAPRNKTIWQDRTMFKVSKFKWVPRTGWRDMAFELLRPAIRFTKDQCLELPPKTYETREVPISKQQMALYNMIKTQLVAQVVGTQITADTASAGMLKLLQASCGSVYTDDHKVVDLDITPRYKELRSVIDECEHKVLVFVPYRAVIDRLVTMLKADGYTVAMIDGRVSANERARLIRQFQNEPDPKVFVLQPAAVSHGITLHAADTSVWWGPIMSNEIYTQANDRMHRTGQKNPCLVIHLSGTPMEKLRYGALRQMHDNQQSLLELYRSVLGIT
jgi:hypothetical protein